MLESSTPTGASAAADSPASAESNQDLDQDRAANPAPAGLRERKKQQTRLRIIEVGLDLCDAHGFDATTVEQIANAADVSPRTINRYFDSKEDIILGPIKDFGRTVAETLRGLPVTGNELQALREAFLRTVDQAVDGNDMMLSFRQFQQMQRILRSSPSVSARSLEHADNKTAAIAEVLAERLQTQPDALEVRLIVGTWQLIGQLGMECSVDIFDDGDPAAAALAGRTAFLSTFDEFVRICCVPLATATR
ncbi:TetR/AcrR family transcriptional regulator [Nocardia sp. NBC_01009]|uniref:TetR/AcrR family transcriptional regulator n=1 Tax=Nocardia sp. NBC_01009 TaxID=2975996 RepID=UPI00386B1EDC|nr:TetR/AcrR family transcriptional regulator [Nocardia sp. NBC_01009]